MRLDRTISAAVALLLAVSFAGIRAQGPAGGRQGGAGNPQGTFPAQQRPAGDPALVARGRTLYDLTCRSCHGVDLRGGDLGGPNLLRSPLVLNDRAGEQILPVIRDGISTPGSAGMPPQPLSEDDARAVAEYIHNVLAAAPGQGAPPPGPPVLLDLLVGDARAGRAYFEARCTSCHSAAGDLQGIGARIPDPKALQNTWVRGGPARGRGGRPSARAEVRVTVTDPSGARTEGRLDRIDDFLVVLTQADGRQRSFTRRRDVPKVEVDDPMARHAELLSVYTDRDVHDVTAYLITLR